MCMPIFQKWKRSCRRQNLNKWAVKRKIIAINQRSLIFMLEKHGDLYFLCVQLLHHADCVGSHILVEVGAEHVALGALHSQPGFAIQCLVRIKWNGQLPFPDNLHVAVFLGEWSSRIVTQLERIWRFQSRSCRCPRTRLVYLLSHCYQGHQIGWPCRLVTFHVSLFWFLNYSSCHPILLGLMQKKNWWIDENFCNIV